MGLLEVKGLFISFGGIQALAGIDFHIEENELLAVIGPNGSGKTTLFNCISGVYRPTFGEILFEGESLLGLSPDAIAKRGIARTFQNLRLFMHMDVLDNLMLGRHVKFRKKPPPCSFQNEDRGIAAPGNGGGDHRLSGSSGLSPGPGGGLPLRGPEAGGDGPGPVPGTQTALSWMNRSPV